MCFITLIMSAHLSWKLAIHYFSIGCSYDLRINNNKKDTIYVIAVNNSSAFW